MSVLIKICQKLNNVYILPSLTIAKCQTATGQILSDHTNILYAKVCIFTQMAEQI